MLYPRTVVLLEQAGDIDTLFPQGNDALLLFASSTISNYILPELIAGYRHTVPDMLLLSL